MALRVRLRAVSGGVAAVLLLAAFAIVAGPLPGGATALTPGDHVRHLQTGGLPRSYRVHLPPGQPSGQALPVVLALHGAGMNGALMARFCGLNTTADQAGFVAVYPDGTGAGPFLVWNAGGFTGRLAEGRPDDVAFVAALLDDLATVLPVDTNRVYACGLSNGAMMCYRLAAELSTRIAAIAPVAGTIAIAESQPQRPVPVLHFHGTADTLVPFAAGSPKGPMQFKGVEDSIQTWVKLNGCADAPRTELLTQPGDDLPVTRRTYSGGRGGAEVVLVEIQGGGHTWPGQAPMVGFLGRTTTNVHANNLIWEFFQKHPRPAPR